MPHRAGLAFAGGFQYTTVSENGRRTPHRSGWIDLEEMQRDFTGSMLDLMIQRGDPPLVNSHCEINAVAANSDVARALNIQRGDALLCFSSRLYDINGIAVDYSISYFLPGYFRFHVVRELAKH